MPTLASLKSPYTGNALLAVTMTLLFGCMCVDRRAFTTVDPWYNPPPVRRPAEALPVNPARVHQVVEARKAETEMLLDEAPCTEVSVERASALTGKVLTLRPGTRPFLVRSLYLNRQTGRFSLYMDGVNLYVHHGSLGRGPVPMQRQPLVVELDRKPRTVYVTCSMAE